MGIPNVLRWMACIGGVVLCACRTSSQDAGRNTGDSGLGQVVIRDAGGGAPVAPSGAEHCPVGCNYQTQQGCDAGAMCHPELTAEQTIAPSCLPAGTRAVGESCSWQQCQPGLICASDGYCRHMCCGADWSVCQANESCTGAIELLPSGSKVPLSAGVGVCEPTDECDVFDSSTCPVGQSCSIVDSRGGVRCLPSGTAEAYDSCSANSLCKPGLICIAGKNGLGQCRRLCRAEPAGVPACPEQEGMVCAHYPGDPEGVGECVPAAG